MAGNGKGGRDFLDLGDWNAVCSMCGRKRKASEMVRNWQGMFRCPEHNEARHPQEYVRAVPDIQTPPWVQPPCDEFAGVCFPEDICDIADFAVADCAICDFTSPMSPAVVPSTTIYVDDFIDADNTLLANHVSNSGHRYGGISLTTGSGAVFPTTKKISSDRLVSTNSDYGLVTPSWTPPSANYYIQAVVRFVPVIVTSCSILLAGRVQDRANAFGETIGYILELGYDNPSVSWLIKIWSLNAGVLVDSLTLPALTVNQDYTLKFVLSGSTLTGYLDGVQKVTGTDTALTAAGVIGATIFTQRVQVGSIQSEAL